MEKNFNKKNKFIENINGEINKQPYYENLKDVNMNDVIKDNYNSRHKSQMELKLVLDPFDYDLTYKDGIKKDVKGTEEFVYYSPYNQGAGRGFGNLSINNTIRNSESSRTSFNDFKLHRESEIIDRFEFIDNRYTKPENLVFPFPRSGEMTRKNLDNDSDTNKIYNHNLEKPNYTENVIDYNEPNHTEAPFDLDYEQTKKKKIAYINMVIEQLKMHYGNKLTKEIIRQYLNDNPPEKYVLTYSDANYANKTITPNNKLINDLNQHNMQEREKQKEYKKKLAYVESVISKLKLQYGSNLTKEIINQYLINNPPEKYILSYSKKINA
jgi:hypothetical protein